MTEPITCAYCGAENPPGSRFCDQCAQPLPAAGAPQPVAGPPPGAPPASVPPLAGTRPAAAAPAPYPTASVPPPAPLPGYPPPPPAPPGPAAFVPAPPTPAVPVEGPPRWLLGAAGGTLLVFLAAVAFLLLGQGKNVPPPVTATPTAHATQPPSPTLVVNLTATAVRAIALTQAAAVSPTPEIVSPSATLEPPPATLTPAPPLRMATDTPFVVVTTVAPPTVTLPPVRPTKTKTPTRTPTRTPTLVPTHTPTFTPTRTPTLTPTHTPTNTPTNVPRPTPTPVHYFVTIAKGTRDTPNVTGTPAEIKRGEIVVWDNQTDQEVKIQNLNGDPDLQLTVGPRASVSYQFNTTGSISYRCNFGDGQEQKFTINVNP